MQFIKSLSGHLFRSPSSASNTKPPQQGEAAQQSASKDPEVSFEDILVQRAADVDKSTRSVNFEDSQPQPHQNSANAAPAPPSPTLSQDDANISPLDKSRFLIDDDRTDTEPETDVEASSGPPPATAQPAESLPAPPAGAISPAPGAPKPHAPPHRLSATALGLASALNESGTIAAPMQGGDAVPLAGAQGPWASAPAPASANLLPPSTSPKPPSLGTSPKPPPLGTSPKPPPLGTSPKPPPLGTSPVAFLPRGPQNQPPPFGAGGKASSTAGEGGGIVLPIPDELRAVPAVPAGAVEAPPPMPALPPRDEEASPPAAAPFTSSRPPTLQASERSGTSSPASVNTAGSTGTDGQPEPSTARGLGSGPGARAEGAGAGAGEVGPGGGAGGGVGPRSAAQQFGARLRPVKTAVAARQMEGLPSREQALQGEEAAAAGPEAAPALPAWLARPVPPRGAATPAEDGAAREPLPASAAAPAHLAAGRGLFRAVEAEATPEGEAGGRPLIGAREDRAMDSRMRLQSYLAAADREAGEGGAAGRAEPWGHPDRSKWAPPAMKAPSGAAATAPPPAAAPEDSPATWQGAPMWTTHGVPLSKAALPKPEAGLHSLQRRGDPSRAGPGAAADASPTAGPAPQPLSRPAAPAPPAPATPPSHMSVAGAGGGGAAEGAAEVNESQNGGHNVSGLGGGSSDLEGAVVSGLGGGSSDLEGAVGAEERPAGAGPAAGRQAHVSKEGFLFKRSGNFVQSWNKYYFLVGPDAVAYRKDPYASSERDIPFKDVVSIAHKDVFHRSCIVITCKSRSYILAAGSKDLANEWIQAISARWTAFVDRFRPSRERAALAPPAPPAAPAPAPSGPAPPPASATTAPQGLITFGSKQVPAVEPQPPSPLTPGSVHPSPRGGAAASVLEDVVLAPAGGSTPARRGSFAGARPLSSSSPRKSKSVFGTLPGWSSSPGASASPSPHPGPSATVAPPVPPATSTSGPAAAPPSATVVVAPSHLSLGTRHVPAGRNMSAAPAEISSSPAGDMLASRLEQLERQLSPDVQVGGRARERRLSEAPSRSAQSHYHILLARLKGLSGPTSSSPAPPPSGTLQERMQAMREQRRPAPAEESAFAATASTRHPSMASWLHARPPASAPPPQHPGSSPRSSPEASPGSGSPGTYSPTPTLGGGVAGVGGAGSPEQRPGGSGGGSGGGGGSGAGDWAHFYRSRFTFSDPGPPLPSPQGTPLAAADTQVRLEGAEGPRGAAGWAPLGSFGARLSALAGGSSARQEAPLELATEEGPQEEPAAGGGEGGATEALQAEVQQLRWQLESSHGQQAALQSELTEARSALHVAGRLDALEASAAKQAVVPGYVSVAEYQAVVRSGEWHAEQAAVERGAREQAEASAQQLLHSLTQARAQARAFQTKLLVGDFLSPGHTSPDSGRKALSEASPLASPPPAPGRLPLKVRLPVYSEYVALEAIMGEVVALGSERVEYLVQRIRAEMDVRGPFTLAIDEKFYLRSDSQAELSLLVQDCLAPRDRHRVVVYQEGDDGETRRDSLFGLTVDQSEGSAAALGSVETPQ